MSKIGKSKTSLLTEFFYYDSEILSSQIKLQKKMLLLYFLKFFNEKYLEIFYVTILNSDNGDK
jgi:hypothetical protein